MKKPTLFLYTDRTDTVFDIEGVVQGLQELGFSAVLKGDFFESLGISSLEIADELARCRILDVLSNGSLNNNPDEYDITLEKKVLESHKPLKLNKDYSNIYDGYDLSRLLRAYVKTGLHIIVTSRMFATFEGSRYHGRTILMDFPLAVISTTGIVEAPAKPREFYIKLAGYNKAQELGIAMPGEDDYVKTLNDEFKGQFIEYNDPRLTEVVKGYILQAIFYLLWGEAFCEKKDCRLYNAHTQEDMLHAQIESSGLCNIHQKKLDDEVI